MPKEVKLTAKLVGKAPKQVSAPWAINDLGEVIQLVAQAKPTKWKLPEGWRGIQIVQAEASKVWVAARQSQTSYGVLVGCLVTGEWSLCFSSDVPPVIGRASGSGVWIATGRSIIPIGFTPLSLPPLLPIEAVDVTEGIDGSLWAVGGEKRYGGFAVWHLNRAENNWHSLPKPAAAIALVGAADGTAWSVSSRGQIWRLHPDGAGKFAECGVVPTCRNCLYSPSSFHVSGLSISNEGAVWFFGQDAHGNAIWGWLADLSTRSVTHFLCDFNLVSIAAPA